MWETSSKFDSFRSFVREILSFNSTHSAAIIPEWYWCGPKHLAWKPHQVLVHENLTSIWKTDPKSIWQIYKKIKCEHQTSQFAGDLMYELNNTTAVHCLDQGCSTTVCNSCCTRNVASVSHRKSVKKGYLSWYSQDVLYQMLHGFKYDNPCVESWPWENRCSSRGRKVVAYCKGYLSAPPKTTVFQCYLHHLACAIRVSRTVFLPSIDSRQRNPLAPQRVALG